MPTPSPAIISLLLPFAVALTAPARAKLLILFTGAVLAPGRRTVCAALAAAGRRETATFGKFHRFFNRDQWSAGRLSGILAALLVAAFVPTGEPIVVLIDETLERRRGRQIDYKGWFRDPIRSSAGRLVCCLGIRWLCAGLLVSVPWSTRPWALPFFVVPVLAEKTCQRLRRPHRSSVSWAGVVAQKLRRWFPERAIVLVGDGGFAAVELVAACQQEPPPVTLVCRLRLDAALYAFPEPQPQGKRGPKPKKGARQQSPRQRLTDPHTGWQRVTLPWYGGAARPVELATGVALWYTAGQAPVPLRWVIVRPPAGDPAPFPPVVLGCSAPKTAALAIGCWFVGRWNIEVTFEEIRAHLGFETQRQWAVRAIGRGTPCLFGLFSLIVLLAKQLHPEQLPCQRTGWYRKKEATFSDVLAAVRRHLWGLEEFTTSPLRPDYCLIPRVLLAGLQHVACYST